MNKWITTCVVLMVLLGFHNVKAEEKSWVDRVKVNGDFRYRHEFIGQDVYHSTLAKKVRGYDRNRQRIRLRLGLQFQVNDRMDMVTRFGTSTFLNGGGDPISTNQDLSGGFTPKPFWLDRAFLDFHPNKRFNARVGRQPVPFENTDLVWDPDLNLEGIAALGSYQTGNVELFLRAGGFWAGERGPSIYKKPAMDQGLFASQLGGKWIAKKITAQVAVAYMDYGNVKNNPTLFVASNGFGNSLTPIVRSTAADSLGYLYDYNLLNINGTVKMKFSRVEPALLFDFVTNSGAETDPVYNKKLNTSWMAGFSIKFPLMPVNWDLAYNYRDQQKDAVIGAFTDSDPAGGGTNYNGHKITAGAPVMKNTRLALTYYRNVKDPNSEDKERKLGYDRITADIEVKF